MRKMQIRSESLPKSAVVPLLVLTVGVVALIAFAQQPPAGPEPKATTGLVPLTELGQGQYKGQDGGLYGGGQNQPPETHHKAAQAMLNQIKPLDTQGQPADDGKIVLISVGMSNTTQEFSYFKGLADQDPDKSPKLVIVDGAQGGQDATAWAEPERRTFAARPDPWTVLAQRLQAAGVTPAQVQVAWLKQALIQPRAFGEFPAHAELLQRQMAKIVQMLKQRYPNLRIVYLSSRIYAGYATTPLNPEPYAYESAFSVRWLIQDQIKGNPDLNYDPARGEVKAPLLLWGPYLWGDGVTPRKADGLVWNREDLAGDGTHPSTSGREKVAKLLLNFFKTDPNAKSWFLKTE